jgi:hypothetical protein
VTSQGTDDISGEGMMMGGPLALTLYGMVVVLADITVGKEAFPESLPKVGLLMIAILIVGTILGAGLDRARR